MSAGLSFDDIVRMAARARDVRREAPLYGLDRRRVLRSIGRGYEKALRDEANRLMRERTFEGMDQAFVTVYLPIPIGAAS